MFRVDDEDDDEIFGSTCVDALAKTLSVRILDKTFTLSQQLEPEDLAPLFSDAWTGSQIWQCSVKLSEYLGRLVESGDLSFRRKRVVELGAGCGLCSLFSCALGAHTLATDQETMVPLIRRNAEQNACLVSSERFRVQELIWGDQAAAAKLSASCDEDPIDFILISDCLNPIYGEDSYEDLAKTVVWLSSTDTEIFLAYEHRDGTGSASRTLLREFFRHLERTFDITLVHREDDIDIFRMRFSKTKGELDRSDVRNQGTKTKGHG